VISDDKGISDVEIASGETQEVWMGICVPTCQQVPYIQIGTTYLNINPAYADSDNDSLHKWNDGAVTKEATATKDGEKTFTCSKCKGTTTEAIPATHEPYMESKADGTNYLYGKDDKLVKDNFVTIDAKLYYANSKGKVMIAKVFTAKNGKKYYADENGVICQDGKFKVAKSAGGGYVYAKKSGELLASTAKTVDDVTYIADKNGKLVKSGLTTVKDNTYYLKNYKVVKDKKIKVGTKTYIAQANGKIAKNKVVKYNGKKYVAKKSGALVIGGKYTISNKTYANGVVTKVIKKK
jgi:hypothetical protein